MTLQEYEIILEEVKKYWDKYPEWVKKWTRIRLIEMVQAIEKG